MEDEIRKGIKGQLVGLNLWILAILLVYITYLFLLESFFGFVMILSILIILIIGLVRTYSGLFHIIRGSPLNRGKRFGYLGGFMAAFSPFFIFLGFISPRPINYIMLQIGLWLFLGSFVAPYLPIGGAVTGIMALLSLTGMSLMILGFIFSTSTLPAYLFLILLTGYLFLLEITMFISYFMSMRREARKPGGLVPVERKTDFRRITEPVERARSLYTETPEPVVVRSARPPEPASAPEETEVPADGRIPVGRAVDMGRFSAPLDMGASKGRGEDGETGNRGTEKGPGSGEKQRSGDGAPRSRVKAEVEEEISLDLDDVLIDGMDLYAILRVARNASPAELKRAYRRRALLYHPDLNREAGELYKRTIAEEMQKLNRAKEILFDPARREVYDGLLETIEKGS
ncbi:MAG: hypothetical protein DRN57_06880 [Thermoplasmata archaeon]|nr:MAG: hypothetical protein DRN57_06880 [Thermoplasmata archaeon]